MACPAWPYNEAFHKPSLSIFYGTCRLRETKRISGQQHIYKSFISIQKNFISLPLSHPSISNLTSLSQSNHLHPSHLPPPHTHTHYQPTLPQQCASTAKPTDAAPNATAPAATSVSCGNAMPSARAAVRPAPALLASGPLTSIPCRPSGISSVAVVHLHCGTSSCSSLAAWPGSDTVAFGIYASFVFMWV